MKHALAPMIALALALGAAAPASAACYASYKAKQDDPLQLHFGVIRLGDGGACPASDAAARQVARRIAVDGWQLLSVTDLSTAPPSDQQRTNAGQYYLRY